MKSLRATTMHLGTNETSNDKSQDILATACLAVGLEDFQEIDEHHTPVKSWPRDQKNVPGGNLPPKNPSSTEAHSPPQNLSHKSYNSYPHYPTSSKSAQLQYQGYYNYSSAYRGHPYERQYSYPRSYYARPPFDPRNNNRYSHYPWPAQSYQQNGVNYSMSTSTGITPTWQYGSVPNAGQAQDRKPYPQTQQTSSSSSEPYPLPACRYAPPSIPPGRGQPAPQNTSGVPEPSHSMLGQSQPKEAHNLGQRNGYANYLPTKRLDYSPIRSPISPSSPTIPLNSISSYYNPTPTSIHDYSNPLQTCQDASGIPGRALHRQAPKWAQATHQVQLNQQLGYRESDVDSIGANSYLNGTNNINGFMKKPTKHTQAESCYTMNSDLSKFGSNTYHQNSYNMERYRVSAQSCGKDPPRQHTTNKPHSGSTNSEASSQYVDAQYANNGCPTRLKTPEECLVSPSETYQLSSPHLNSETSIITRPNPAWCFGNVDPIELAKRMEKKEIPPKQTVQHNKHSNYTPPDHNHLKQCVNSTQRKQLNAPFNNLNQINSSHMAHGTSPDNGQAYHTYKLSVQQHTGEHGVIRYSMPNANGDRSSQQNVRSEKPPKRVISSETFSIPGASPNSPPSLEDMYSASSYLPETHTMDHPRSISEPSLYKEPDKMYQNTSRPKSLPNIVDSNQPREVSLSTSCQKMSSFLKKLQPVLEHLLNTPEASSLQSLRGDPDELLEHLVRLWGGDYSKSSSNDPMVRIKANFSTLVRFLFKPDLLLEWGWKDAPVEKILDDLVQPSNGTPEWTMISTLKDLVIKPSCKNKEGALNPIPPKKRSSPRLLAEPQHPKDHVTNEPSSDKSC